MPPATNQLIRGETAAPQRTARGRPRPRIDGGTRLRERRTVQIGRRRAGLADAGRASRPAEHPRQRPLDLLGQPRRLPAIRSGTMLCNARRQTSHLPGRRWSDRLADASAIPALHLAESPDQSDARADRAPVQVGHPVEGDLAVRADQHLAVATDSALPGTLPPVRVHLPGAAPIAGHSDCSDSAVAPERVPALIQRSQGLLVFGDVSRLRDRVDYLPPYDAVPVDDEGPARGDTPVLVEDTVGPGHAAVRPEIGQ